MSDHLPVTDDERPRLFARILANCVEVGACLVWRGACSGPKPVMTFRGGTRYVRALMYEAHHGTGAPPGMQLVPMCRNPQCVAPECIAVLTRRATARMDAARGVYSRPAANAARLLSARRRASVSEAVVEAIRAFEGSCAQASQATGVSLSHCKDIRAGRKRRPLVGDVWRGLSR